MKVKLSFTRPGPTAYAAVAGTLGALLLLLWMVDGGGSYSYYLDSMVGPELQATLGFDVGYVTIGDQRWKVITRVVPGGAMARAGVREGETGCPRGLTGLYETLRTLERESAAEVCLMTVTETGRTVRRVVVQRGPAGWPAGR